MAERVVVYVKQSGELKMPVTARIEWFPDGTIMPCCYWTPDAARFEVVSQGAGVSLALLKDRSEGLRFKVRTKIVETNEPLSEMLHSQHETELYLADRRFYEKCIIDERYVHANKEFVRVTLDVFPNGEYTLVYFWCRGVRYMVEKTIAVEPRGSLHAGGVGLWHKMEVRLINADDDEDPDPNMSVCRLAALFLEFNKWFVYVTSTA